MSTIIIARYNENIDWLLKYQDFNVIIYNKGSCIANKGLGEIITLPNVGRESHTWLYHIVSNYQNLDEVNIFLQGRIDDLGVLAYQDLYKYQNECIRKGFSVRRFGILGPFHWVKYLGLEKNSKYKDQLTNKSLKEPEISFKELAQTFIPKIPLFTITNYGGCFAVKKELILSHNHSFYKNLLKPVSNHKNPIEGHYLERLWCYMFTKNSLLIDSFKDVVKTKLERSKFIK